MRDNKFSDRKFGVEIEFGGGPYISEVEAALLSAGLIAQQESYNHATRSYWKITPDASIEGFLFGTKGELVSPPLSGRDGLAQVRLALDVLQRLGCRVNKSCGFHVHWDCSDFTGDKVRNLLALYAKFELIVDGLVAPSRRGNDAYFCRSLRQETWIEGEGDMWKWIKRSKAGGTRLAVGELANVQGNLLRRSNNGCARYMKVNVTAYLTHGTVEFRQHQGTVNADKAINWIVLTQMFVERAVRGKVSHEPTAKPKLGEMFRILWMCDHHGSDPLVHSCREYMKRRYKELCGRDSETA